MGFLSFGWLKVIAKAALQLLGGGGVVPTESGAPFSLAQILPAVERAIRYGGLDSKAKFDEWLIMADQATGSEPGAVHLFGDLPPDKEEELWDHAIAVARIYGYHLLKVTGYYTSS
jgi:hypothetical protein